jgi:hypothetical protein
MPPWTQSEVPAFGQLVTAVPPKIALNNARRIQPTGHPMVFLGLHSMNATYDRSVIVCDLQTLVDTGKVRLWRTRDWRRPPGPPRFPLKALAEQLDALKAGKNVCNLSDAEYTDGIFELGNGQTPSIKWMTQFVSDDSFGQEPENEENNDEDIPVYGDESRTDSQDAALAISDGEVLGIQPEPEQPDSDTLSKNSDDYDERLFSQTEAEALREFSVLKSSLEKYSSYGGGFDELTNKPIRRKANSPRPSHI